MSRQRDRETERDSTRGGGTERERERGRDTQNLKQAPGSELSSQSPIQGWKSVAMRS